MVYKFRLLSSEADDFIRDFEVLSGQTFYDLHLAIQKNLHYDLSQIASFFLCNDEWEKEQEITLFDHSDDPSTTVMVMDNTVFSDQIAKLKQKFLYVFDVFNERTFFIEVVEIKNEIPDQSIYPLCTLSEGLPPQQILIDDIFLSSDSSVNSENLGVDHASDFNDTFVDDLDLDDSIFDDNTVDEE